jgi:hypothetical protein
MRAHETDEEKKARYTFIAEFWFRGYRLATVCELKTGVRYFNTWEDCSMPCWNSTDMILFSTWIAKAANFLLTGHHLSLELEDVSLS